MDFIKNYKNKKKNHIPIKLIINSNIDYNDHDINILRACLDKWSNSTEMGIGTNSFKYNWIYSDITSGSKLYFINTNMEQLKNCGLEKIINNPLLQTKNYMDSITEKMIFLEEVI